jgi:2-polyprenyl-6-hydroxyphenyl methylase/3-demethylubiquinone-9 3-methyltransferase
LPVDNDLYDRLSHTWWDEDSFLGFLRVGLNPVRFGYFRGVLERFGVEPAGRSALDVGCGGGLLAEEFARIGCAVTGLDPSVRSLDTARRHAEAEGLGIDYREGVGEDLPFSDGSFGIAYCCDVLEHVDDLDRVVAETARVLEPGGLYFYDTINRTVVSRATNRVIQDWDRTRFVAPGLHDPEMFVKPSELNAAMERHGLVPAEIVGIRPHGSPLGLYRALRRHREGRITGAELARRLAFRPSRDTLGSYMGFGVKVAGRSVHSRP